MKPYAAAHHHPMPVHRAAMPNPRVLLVDDDAASASVLADYLQHDGFDAERASDGEAGLSEALSGRHDIVILDVIMSGMTGLDVLRTIRSQSRIPVLVLTSRSDEIDRVVGLELGADDYLTKPCSARELAARLRAVLRRLPTDEAPTSLKAPTSIQCGSLTVWPMRREADWDGEAIPLTATEFSLLEMLMRHAGELVTRDKLYQEVLGTAFDSADRSIDVHVSRLRQKLAVFITPELLIKTVRRRGYLFVKN